MNRRLQDLVERLQASPDVMGLVRYGGRRLEDNSPGGDFDLFAVLRHKDPQLESIHFYWGDIPVDLGLRTLDDLKRPEPDSWVDKLLAQGEVLSDATGEVTSLLGQAAARWITDLPAPPEAQVAAARFYQQHVLGKVNGRLAEDPIFAQMLLSINICWLMHIYYSVRAMNFPGERAALAWLREHEPEIASRIERFFESVDVQTKYNLSVELTDLVLAPVGGPWRRGEILGVGADDHATNLNARAAETWRRLMGEAEGGHGVPNEGAPYPG